MKGKARKPRSAQVQIIRMGHKWPDLVPKIIENGRFIAWTGPLRGFQMRYLITVIWEWNCPTSTPKVHVLDPPISPRPGTDFIDLPHLNYDKHAPERSALCLFDPDAAEWNNTMLIADRIVPWASEWLHHYELWHLDGVWRGANAPGPICIRDMLRQEGEEVYGAGS